MNNFGPKSYPVKIAAIETDGNTSVAKLDVDAIREVIQKNGIEDVPVALVAVAGIARKGKSFLLNLMVEYLEHMTKSPSSDFEASSDLISGMNWAGGREAVTKGIWLWGEAFIINRNDGSKVAILLVDTQGINDGIESAQAQVDSQIIYMTLSMATIYIQNVSQTWGMSEKRVYQVCQSFSDVYGTFQGGNEPLFNSFTLLFRDWIEDSIFGERPDVFEDEITRCEKNREAFSIMTGIKNLFHHKTAWVLPEPSKAVRKGQEKIPLTDIGQDFLDNVVLLSKALFSPDGQYNNYMDCKVTGRRFLERIKDLSERLTVWPADLKTDADQLKDMFLRRNYHTAKEQFEDCSKSIEDSDNMEEIDAWFIETEISACDRFKQLSGNVQTSEKFYKHYHDKLLKVIGKKKELCCQTAELKVKHRQVIERLEKLQKKQEDSLYRMKKAIWTVTAGVSTAVTIPVLALIAPPSVTIIAALSGSLFTGFGLISTIRGKAKDKKDD